MDGKQAREAIEKAPGNDDDDENDVENDDGFAVDDDDDNDDDDGGGGGHHISDNNPLERILYKCSALHTGLWTQNNFYTHNPTHTDLYLRIGP